MLAWLLYGCSLWNPSWEIDSPDGKLTVTVTLDDGIPRYALSHQGAPVIHPSRLGFVFRDQPSLNGDLAVTSEQADSQVESWEQPWGEERVIEADYTGLTLKLEERSQLRRHFFLELRAYNDGIGFRCELPEQANLNDFLIMDEQTEFVLAGEHTAWWIPAFWWNRYEYLYRETSLAEIDTVHTPLTLRRNDGLHLSIHEAALTDYASMTLRRSGRDTLQCELVPWSDGVKVRGKTPHHTPWRTVTISADAAGLVTSRLILNLNEPNRLPAADWIKPGKYIGIWWGMHTGEYSWSSGENHGATTARACSYIDFAAEHGFQGVLVEGWNPGWDNDWTRNGELFDFTQAHPDFDLELVTAYAGERGVGLIGHHETGAAAVAYEQQLEEALALYERLGVNTIKTGYVGWEQNIKRPLPEGEVALEWHHGQFMVRHYRRVVEAAARHRIMLDVHEPIKATGIRRTWPNMMTREGARGQEFNAWGPEGGNPPEHTVLLPFTRLLGGPLDFTPGIFELLLPDNPDNRVNTTLAKQLALYVVIYSPLQMAADLPEHYENQPAFKFIEDVPVDWETTLVPHARVGEYITIVRQDRNSPDWYLGSITDSTGRTLTLALDFLEPGQEYRAEIYADAPTADWQENPLALEIENRSVSSETELTLVLAPGGGQAIRFHPLSIGE
ncbi:MAG: glycoside hydrolase family 97 protein [Candidatus Delongbacteria bacterium]|nr:glycoside hydrolase family 97 protein [Candidatus Delongbacteria bacterium]